MAKISSPNEIRLIIVSGSPKLAEIYSNFFRMAGVQVVKILHSAQDFLSYVKSNAAALVGVIILYDYSSLKDRSLQELKQVKEIIPNMKVVLLSNRFLRELQDDAALFDSVLLKPFTIKEFFDIINNLLSRI